MIRTPISQAHRAAPRTSLHQLLCAAALSAAAAIVPAQADVIDFEGYFGPTAHAEAIQTAGYNVGFYSLVNGAKPGEDLAGSFLDGSDPESCDVNNTRCPVNNPTTYYGALNDSYVDIMSSTSRTRFSVKGFDASFIGGAAALDSYPAVAGLLRIQGFFGNGTFASETYQLAGPSSAGFNFGHYNTTAAFSKLAFKEVAMFGFVCNNQGDCSAFNSDRAQFGIDNIELAVVPEPASFLLFAIGMIGMGAVARRRRNSL